MNINESVAPLTVGNIQGLGQASNGVWYSPYDSGSSWPWQTHIYTTPSKPYLCDADVHVFACEHATACKCGKAHRKPEPKKCGACGK